MLRSKRAEKYAGYSVVLTIFVSACIVAFEAIQRFHHPQSVNHLLTLALGGAIGFLGNEIAAIIRIRAGKRLNSPALIADGAHARVDGVVSISVVATAFFLFLNIPIADPVIAIIITGLILRVTWQSFATIHHQE